MAADQARTWQQAVRRVGHVGESAGGAEHDAAAVRTVDGHRVKAIEHLDQAIKEAEICMSMK